MAFGIMIITLAITAAATTVAVLTSSLGIVEAFWTYTLGGQATMGAMLLAATLRGILDPRY